MLTDVSSWNYGMNSGDKGTIGNNYTGAINSANNSFEVLNGGSFQTTAPNVIYWDLQSNYDKHTPDRLESDIYIETA